MLIRTFQKEKNIKKTIIIIVSILIGILLIGKLGKTIYTQITAPSKVTIDESKIGTELTIKGDIEAENNFPLYTHNISNTTQKFYLKSSSVNLNKYIGEGNEVIGTITDTYKGSAILEVHTIKIASQGLLIKNNIFFFVKDLIYLDFSNQNQLSADKKDKEVNINFNNNKLFSIERFLCSRVLKNKSCTYLIDDYGQTQKETFDSYWGYTFYKHGSGLRTVFDGNMFGYIFKNIDDNMMIDMSSMIRIVDKNFILTNKEQQIKEVCKSEYGSIQQITFSTIKHENNDNLITIIVDGEISKKKVVNCEVTFDLRNQRKIKNVKISNK